MDITCGPKLYFTFTETETDLTIKWAASVQSDVQNMDHALLTCRRINPIKYIFIICRVCWKENIADVSVEHLSVRSCVSEAVHTLTNTGD